MTSAKMNRAIIKSVMDALSKAGFDPSRAHPGPASRGLFTSEEDAKDAERVPALIIATLKDRVAHSQEFSKEEMQRFVEKEAWSRSFYISNAAIGIELAFGGSPKRRIQEAREAIQALRAMGAPEADIADMFEGFLRKKIGEE